MYNTQNTRSRQVSPYLKRLDPRHHVENPANTPSVNDRLFGLYRVGAARSEIEHPDGYEMGESNERLLVCRGLAISAG